MLCSGSNYEYDKIKNSKKCIIYNNFCLNFKASISKLKIFWPTNKSKDNNYKKHIIGSKYRLIHNPK